VHKKTEVLWKLGHLQVRFGGMLRLSGDESKLGTIDALKFGGTISAAHPRLARHFPGAAQFVPGL